MQRESNGNTEPEHTTKETTLARCLVDGDTATKARDRRRRRKALGISFAAEFIFLALLIAAPLMTSVARPHFNAISFVPIVFGGSHAHSSTQHLPSGNRHLLGAPEHPFTFTVGRVPSRPMDSARETEGPSNSDSNEFNSILN
jgi:hypothetical protein